MATENNQMSDEVTITQRGGPDGEVTVTYGAQPEPLPNRPADGAPKAKWVDYVVALGADRDYVEGNTDHWDAEAALALDPDDPALDFFGSGYVTHSGLTVPELRDLADRLGG